MSLISDALRKARQEISGRDAEGRGLMVPPGWDRPSSGSRLGAGLVLGAAIALAAALAGAAIVWWAVGRTDDGAHSLQAEGEMPEAVVERPAGGVDSQTTPDAGGATPGVPGEAERELSVPAAVVGDSADEPARGDRDLG
jgi:hypothetical protein